jgi:hypothetical protein
VLDVCFQPKSLFFASLRDFFLPHYKHGEYVYPKLIPGPFTPADNRSNDYNIDRVAQGSFSGLDHGVGHPKSLFVMPPYATLRSLRCSREGLRCFFACHFCHGSHDKHDRMVPSQTMHITPCGRTFDTSPLPSGAGSLCG